MLLPLRRPTVPVKWILPLLAVNLFIINLGFSISDYPSTRLAQDIICKRHLNLTFDELLPEEDCRGHAVQRELNIVDIGLSVSSTLGGALVSLPLGILADRIGRVPILALSILSLFLSEGYLLFIFWNWKEIPIKATWGAGAILLLGGGRGVTEAMVFTSISDVVPESKRATCFQWAVGAVLSSQLFGPLIARHLVELSIWHPFWIEIGFISFGGIVLALFMPETLPDRDTTMPLVMDSDVETTSSTKDTLKALFRRPTVFLLPGAVLAMPAAAVQYGIITRVMPVQFKWKLEQSALLLSLGALATLITLLLILPGASYMLQRKTDWKSFQRDRVLARASTILVVFGSLFLMMISSKSLVILGLIISAFGSGVPTLCRTMLVAFKGHRSTGSVFGILAAGEVLGLLVFELVIGSLFDVGLRTWLGLPFCLGLAMSLVTCVTTWLVRTPEPGKAQTVTNESQTNIMGQDAAT